MKTIAASDLDCSAFDEIIDVRAPSEFLEDHIPGAINLPVLSDRQREEVGTVYKQESVFEARKIGAAYVSTNIAGHLRDHLKAKPGGYKPLLYCWRGGQRSRSMALVLGQVGWPITLLEGGYKAYRKRVMDDMLVIPKNFEYRVLAGLTGTGKTEILHELAAKGEQVLDLEGLANHQGSLLGEPVAGQKMGQKRFESRLWSVFSTLDPSRPVWTEAESAKIGKVFCPKALLQMLRSSVRIEIAVPMADRVAYLNARYTHWRQKPEAIMEKLKWLHKRHGNAELEIWRGFADAGQWDDFVQRLLEVHYDPAYRSALANASGETRDFSASALLQQGCQIAASGLLDMDWNLGG